MFIYHYRASSSPVRGVVGVVEPLLGDVAIALGAVKYNII